MNKQFLIHNAQIINNVSQFCDKNWQAFKARDEVLEVVVREYKSNRNLEQNKRLHAMLQEIAEQVWIDGKQFGMEIWKEHYKRMFLGVIELPNGQIMASPTRDLNTKECAEFMQKIEAHAVSEFCVNFSK